MEYLAHAIQMMSEKKVVFWGAGRRVSSFIEQYCVEGRLPFPDYICDSTREITQEEICNVPVISFESVKQMKPADTIIVITAGLIDLPAQVVRSELYYFPIFHCRSFEAYFYLQEHRDRYELACSYLEDDFSRGVFRSCLESILKGGLWNQSLYSPSPYFDNDVIGKLSNDDRLVFAGGFNGKHIDRMLLSNSAVEVDAFEPSSYWSNYLKDKFSAQEKITIHNKVLWESYDTLSFDEDEGNGGLDAHVGSGSSHIEGIPIDDYLAGRVTQIVLDVEGSEQKVLRGAAKTIERDRPRLTVCLYHSLDDYINIPIQIKEQYGEDYKLYVKHHSCISAIETVLYAV